MSADPLILDPELEALLKEIASDPDSTLLRVARPRVIRAFLEREDVVRGSDSTLSRAERHLLLVHRSELASVLRRMGSLKLMESPVSQPFMGRHGPSGREQLPFAPNELDAWLRIHRHDFDLDEETSNAFQLIARCVEHSSDETPSVCALAAASHRLEPSNTARLLFAADMGCTGSLRTSLQLASVVLRSSPSHEHATRAWECAGLALGKMGKFDQAHRAYFRGCIVDDQHTYMNRLLFALQVGARDDVVECSRVLNDMLSEDAPAALRFVETRRKRRIDGEWSPTADGLRLVRSMAEHLDGAARRIAHVLA
jgi:hypothetical protein